MYVLYCVVGSTSLANHYPLAPWPVAIKTHFGWLMTASNATRVALYSVAARFCTSRARGGCPSLRPIRPIYGITMPIDHATPLQSTDPLPSTLLIKPEHPTAKALVKRLMLNADSDWYTLWTNWQGVHHHGWDDHLMPLLQKFRETVPSVQGQTVVAKRCQTEVTEDGMDPSIRKFFFPVVSRTCWSCQIKIYKR